MKIYLDLDGTLWDSKPRLYRLFCDLTQQDILNFDEYWDLKRNMHGHPFILKEFLGYTTQEIDTFEIRWLNEIESTYYLKFDALFNFTVPILERLCESGFQLIMVTARQNSKNLKEELESKGIIRYFDQILVTEGTCTKEELVRSSCNGNDQNDFFIGDTGMDIITGKSLKMKTAGVLSGFRSSAFLKKYRPDYIIDNLSEIYDIL